jgi:hypothetical protein
MTQHEYEDYMYEDSELLDEPDVILKASEKLFLNKLDEDAREFHYELLAERYGCI